MPFMTRSRRRLTAGFALAALAFAHGAMASYGCLTGRTPEPQMSCEDHSNSSPPELLCRVHFQSETQTLDLAKVPILPAPDAPVLVPAAERTAVPAPTTIALPARFAMANAPPPRLNILYSRFLI